MTGKTHLLIGIAASLALAVYRPPVEAGLIAGVLLGSLAPDIDHPSSLITTWIPPLRIFSLFFEHRGLLHSAFIPALMAAAAYYLVAPVFWTGLAIGWSCHLAADALTMRGIPAFYPLSKAKIGLPLMVTGGFIEWLFGFVVIGLGGYFIYLLFV